MFIAVAMLGAITVGCSSTAPEAAPGTTTGTDGAKEGGEASKEGMSNTEEGAPAAGTEGAPAAGTEGAPAADGGADAEKGGH